MTRLRQICIAPSLIALTAADYQPSEDTEEAEDRSGKKDVDKKATARSSAASAAMNFFADTPMIAASIAAPTKQSSGFQSSLLGRFQNDREFNAILFRLDKWIRDENGTAGMCASKMNVLSCIIRDKIPPQDKVIVFSTFSSALMIAQRKLSEDLDADAILLMHGGHSEADRKDTLQKFNHLKAPKARVLLMGYTVGSRGLNLTVANWVIFLEPWWSPSVAQQAIARVERIGQQKPMHVFHLVVPFSIETTMLGIVLSKMQLADELLGTKTTDASKVDMLRESLGSEGKVGRMDKPEDKSDKQ